MGLGLLAMTKLRVAEGKGKMPLATIADDLPRALEIEDPEPAPGRWQVVVDQRQHGPADKQIGKGRFHLAWRCGV